MQTQTVATDERGRLASLTAVLSSRTAPASGGFVNQLGRFVLVGAFSALVDYGVYSALLLVDTPVHLAKAISFIVGTTTAYLLNRRFTFDTVGGSGRFAGFLVLYASTFAVNVGVNAAALSLLPEMPLRITLAWVIAQGTATVINFVMLRTVVFRH